VACPSQACQDPRDRPPGKEEVLTAPLAPDTGSPAPRSRTGTWLLLGASLVGVVFALDVITGSDLAFSLFYLLPVSVVAWRVGFAAGLWASLVSAAAWFVASLWTGVDATHPAVLAWNTAMQAGFFLTVAWTLAQLQRGLVRERALAERLAHSYRELDREMANVADLQRALLPARPPVVPGFAFAVHYATSARAGGDYYDFFPLGDGRLGILIADVSGHGAGAAVVMAILRTVLRGSAAPLDSPSRLLAHANRELLANIPEQQFVTAGYAVLDPGARSLELSLAGHMPPVWSHAATPEARALEEPEPCGGPPLGMFADVRYPSTVARLAGGDNLLFYTDGLSEAMDASGELFGADRVRAVVRAQRAQAADGLRDRLLEEVSRHRGETPLADDLTLLVVRVDGAPNPGLGSSPREP